REGGRFGACAGGLGAREGRLGAWEGWFGAREGGRFGACAGWFGACEAWFGVVGERFARAVTGASVVVLGGIVVWGFEYVVFVLAGRCASVAPVVGRGRLRGAGGHPPPGVAARAVVLHRNRTPCR
ncbi:hypothetical protein, partial [Actinomadura sp. CNU-125]|uniref:hypothetical protein n=1 Tax=Actinomadura sp. CNU-125 TaxID=1904961 RepID=UPI0021CCB33E